MNKKIIFILVIIVLAVLVAYFYLNLGKPDLGKTKYTTEDFPRALNTMNQEIFDKTISDLNSEYQKLKEGDHTYIRYINIGILKKRLLDFEGTEQAWLAAIDHSPDQSLAYGNLADLYLFHLRKIEEAEKFYFKALEMKPEDFGLYVGLVSLYRYDMTEKKDQIETIMLGAAGINPAEAQDYYIYLADYFYREGNMQKARDYKDKVLEIDPSLGSKLPNI